MKYIKDIFIFILILSCNSTFAKTFGGTGSDHGYEIIHTMDNGYALLGQYDSSGSDIYIIKLDSSGAVEWTKIYGDINQDDYASSIVQTYDEGFLVMGTRTDASFNLRAWLLRLNSHGDTLWTKTYYDPSTIAQAGAYVDVYDNDQYTIGINSDGITANNFLYLYRTDTLGNILDTLSVSSEYGIVLPVINGYMMTATNSTFPPPTINLFRLDTVGPLSFDNFFYDPNFARSMRSGNSAMCGTGFMTVGSTDLYSANNGQFKFFLMRTDSSGDSLWSKTWGPDFSSLNFILMSNDMNYLIAGNIDSSGHRKDFLWKTDSIGDTLWTKFIGDNLTISSILNSANGNFIVIGDSIDPLSGLSDAWIMWYDSLGNAIYNTATEIIKSNSSDFYFRMYPNPAIDHIAININKNAFRSQSLQLTIEDLTGKIIFSKSINDSVIDIDVSDWSKQMYLIRITDGLGNSSGKKVIAGK